MIGELDGKQSHLCYEQSHMGRSLSWDVKRGTDPVAKEPITNLSLDRKSNTISTTGGAKLHIVLHTIEQNETELILAKIILLCQKADVHMLGFPNTLKVQLNYRLMCSFFVS